MKICPFVCLSVCHHFKFSNIGPLYIIPCSRQTPHIIYCWTVDDVSCHLAMSMTNTKTNTKTNSKTNTKTNTKTNANTNTNTNTNSNLTTVNWAQLSNEYRANDMLTCCQDHMLTENIWFVWSETSYSGDERRCYRCGTNE